MMNWKKSFGAFEPGKWMYRDGQTIYTSGKYTIGRVHAYAFGIMCGNKTLMDRRDRRFPKGFKTLKEAKAECERLEASNA